MTDCTIRRHGYLSAWFMARLIKGKAANDNDGYEFLTEKGK